MTVAKVLGIVLSAAALATANKVDATLFSSPFCNPNSTAIAEFTLNPAGNGGCIAWSSQSVNLVVQGPGCTSVTFYTDSSCTEPADTDIMDENGNWSAGCQTFSTGVFNSFNTQCS